MFNFVRQIFFSDFLTGKIGGGLIFGVALFSGLHGTYVT
jgi:hypothetical protein